VWAAKRDEGGCGVGDEHRGESGHSLDDAMREAAKNVKKKATFRIKDIGGEISANPGTINKFTVVLELTD
jgi:hypothetical protein